jgi:hypothetical protein
MGFFSVFSKLSVWNGLDEYEKMNIFLNPSFGPFGVEMLEVRKLLEKIELNVLQ